MAGSAFPQYYLNTVIVTLAIMVGQILTSAMSGYAFSAYLFPDGMLYF